MLPTAHPKVIYKALSEGAVLFSMQDEVYYGLDPLGAEIWALLDSATSLDALVETLAVRYPEVMADTIRTDVLELFEELAGFGLVVFPAGEHSETECVETSRAEVGEAEPS